MRRQVVIIDPSGGARAAEYLRGTAEVTVLRRWPGRGVDADVVVVATTGSSSVREDLAGIAHSSFRGDVVLVVSARTPAHDLLEGTLCSKVVPMTELRTTVLGTAYSARRECARLLRSVVPPGSALSRLADPVFSAPQPPVSVGELARAVSFTESGIRALWRRMRMPDTPHALVRWGVMAYVADGLESGRSVLRLAAELDVGVSTLYRMGHHTVRCAAGRITVHDTVRRFAEWCSGRVGDNVSK